MYAVGNMYKVRVSSRLWQAVTGKVESKQAIAKIDDLLVKQVNKISNGKVYFNKDAGDTVYIDYTGAFYNAKDFLREQIEKAIEEQIRIGNFEEGDIIIINKTITSDDINLQKLREIVEEIKNEEEERKKQKERKEQIKEQIKEIVKSKEYLRVDFYSDYAKIKAYASNSNTIVEEFTLYYNEDAVKHLENYDFVDVLTKYVEKLEKENEELRKQLNARKEELLKEIYENNETVTITDKCEKELKVISVDDEY